MKLSLKSHDTDLYEQKPHELNLDRAVIKSCGPGTSPASCVEELEPEKKSLAVWFPAYLLYLPGNVKS